MPPYDACSPTDLIQSQAACATLLQDELKVPIDSSKQARRSKKQARHP